MEEKIKNMQQQLKDKRAERKRQPTRNDSSIQFTKGSINASKDTIKSNLNSARKMPPIK